MGDNCRKGSPFLVKCRTNQCFLRGRRVPAETKYDRDARILPINKFHV